MVITIRRWLYKKHFLPISSLPVPVIVVGNITVGGTGKTPLVIALCNWLKTQGYYPGVISRGYKGQINQVHVVSHEDGPSLVGDEPLLIFKEAAVPVAIGKNRYQAGVELLKKYPEINIILSDDGLQHYALQRNLEIVVVDGQRLLGNTYLLPAGPLREPQSRLSTVDAVVINGENESLLDNRQSQFNMTMRPETWINVNNPHLRQPINAFSSERCVAMCAIGNPQRFLNTLASIGVVPFATRIFEDHYHYQENDFKEWLDEKILMTEKDGIKCHLFAPQNVWMLKISAQLDEPFYQWLQVKLTHLRENNGF
ncbi:tetraacyldisaccharide 4'-kinase [Ferrovum sp. PN-J185]|nr:tetraacyldisaccharide 4'-kinase [Ferrovum sp. PN-J185]